VPDEVLFLSGALTQNYVEIHSNESDNYLFTSSFDWGKVANSEGYDTVTDDQSAFQNDEYLYEKVEKISSNEFSVTDEVN
jgi:hypothetical protein